MLTDIENANPLGDVAQRCDYLVSVFAPLGVIVGKDDDIGVVKILGKFIAPLLDAARVRRRREANGVEAFYILLTFGNVDRLPAGDSLD